VYFLNTLKPLGKACLDTNTRAYSIVYVTMLTTDAAE
jgi:hypothetical protein